MSRPRFLKVQFPPYVTATLAVIVCKKKNPTKELRLTTESGGETFALLSKQDFVPHEAFDIFIYCNKLILYWKITRAEKLNTEMTGDHKVNEDTLDGSIAIKN